MNFPGRLVLMLIVAATFASCSSTKNASKGSSSNIFGKVYYRNKVFDKNDAQAVTLPLGKPGSVLIPLNADPRKPVFTNSYASEEPRSPQERLRDLVDQLYNTSDDKEILTADNNRNTLENKTRNKGNIFFPVSGETELWSFDEMLAIGGTGLIFISLMGLMLVKGIQRGMAATGFVVISLLLFLGLLYLIITAPVV